MTLAAIETIDLILLTRSRDALKLVIVATEDLSAGGEPIVQLRSKLTFYHHAIRSGRCDELHPGYAALPKIIQIDHYTPLGPEAAQVLNQCAQEMRSDQIRLVSSESSFNPLRVILNLFRGSKEHEWTA